MKIFEILFGKPKQKEPDFIIEHYPLSNKYYALYKGIYLRWDSVLGAYEQTGSNKIVYAESFKSAEMAEQAIESFKETEFKKGKEIIISRHN